jgi:hypothetical protein
MTLFSGIAIWQRLAGYPVSKTTKRPHPPEAGRDEGDL